MYQGKHIVIDNFSGGYCGNFKENQLQTNQAKDLDQIVILPDGKGLRRRYGNNKYNSSGAINSGAVIYGLGLWEGIYTYFVAVCGTKIYTNSPNSGLTTFTDRTGAVTISAPTYSTYSLFSFGSKIIGIGGPDPIVGGGTPDVPWEIDPAAGTNAAVLTGTPPSAYGGFTANNRVFAYCTASATSTLYWSVLANENDWTGAGSGSAVIGSTSEGGPIRAHAILNTNTLLIFKNGSVHQVVLTTAPFPVYTLFSGVGCVGKNAVVVVDGAAYWINQYKRMVSTDGRTITTYPDGAGDLFNAISPSYSSLICGFRQKGVDYDWIVWCYPSTLATTPDRAVIWDLNNKCWLKCSTGYGFRVAATVLGTTAASYPSGTVFGGTSNGFVVQLAGASNGTDYTASQPVPYWRSGWLQPSTGEEIIQPNRLTLVCSPAQPPTYPSTINLKYGFNFIADSVTTTIGINLVSTETTTSVRTNLTGRGNYFQFYVGEAGTQDSIFNVSEVILSGKVYGQKRLTAS